MTEPLISCIVPVYNGQRYLREALDSILVQTHPVLEIVVVDDGSTDGTADVVRSYGDSVRYLWQPRSGPVVARNLGLGVVQGEFVAFLDADDRWHPEKLSRQVVRFRARPELSASVTHVLNFWSPELAESMQSQSPGRLAPIPGYVTQTLLARRAIFDTVGSFDATLKHASELNWYLRAIAQGEVIELLADVLVYRRLHRHNFSRLSAAASRDQHLKVIKASLDRRRREGDLP